MPSFRNKTTNLTTNQSENAHDGPISSKNLVGLIVLSPMSYKMELWPPPPGPELLNQQFRRNSIDGCIIIVPVIVKG